MVLAGVRSSASKSRNPRQLRRRAIATLAVLIAIVPTAVLVVPTAALAAGTLNTAIAVTEDGSAPFEDNNGNGINDPGDDLTSTNRIVRTLDTVLYKIDFVVDAVSAGAPSTATVVTAKLTGGAVWTSAPPAASCPGPLGATIDPADPTSLSCDLGTVSAPRTDSFLATASVPNNIPNGTVISATSTITNAETTVSASADDVTVSAAPNFEVSKYSIQPSATTLGGQPGYALKWGIALRDLTTDSRGASTLAPVVQLEDQLATSGLSYTLLGCSQGFGALPAVSSDSVNGSNYDYTLGQTAPTTCAQPGGAGTPITISMSPDWERKYPAPSKDLNGSNLDPNYVKNPVGLTVLSVFVSNADIDVAADGVADGVGVLPITNHLNIEQPFSVSDTQGVPNLGGAAEPTGNNTTTDTIDIGDSAGLWRKSMSAADYARPVQTFDGSRWDTSGIFYSNVGSTTQPAGMIVCDKFDSSRFFLYAPASDSSASGLTSPLEYGVGPWGAQAADIQHGWYEQTQANCGDGDVPQWYTADQVDFTNSGLGLVNANEINAVRSTSIRGLQPGESINFGLYFESLDNDAGDYLLNTSAVYFPSSGEWVGTRCSTADDALRACVGPDRGPEQADSLGLRGTPPVPMTGLSASDMAIHVQGPVRTVKSTAGSSTVQPGQELLWKLSTTALNYFESPYGAYPGPNSSAVVSPAVVLKDTLPPGMTPLASGTTLAWTDSTYDATTDQWTVTWSLGDLPLGSTTDVFLNTRVDLDSPLGARTNTSRVSSPGIPDEVLAVGPFAATASATVVAATAAVIYKSTDTGVVSPGDPMSYDLTYANPSSTSIESVDMVDLLPFNGDPRGTVATGSVDLTGITVPNGEQIWVSFTNPSTLDGADGAADGSIDLKSSAYLAQPNAATGSSWWPCLWSQIGTAACPSGATAADVTAVRFIGADPNPAASGAGASFLPAGSGPFTIQLDFDTENIGLNDQYLNTYLAAFSGLAFSARSGAPVPVTRAPDGQLEINKVVDASDAARGDTLTYTVTIANTGNVDAADVAATDVLPAGVTFVSADGSPSVADRSITWTVPTVAAGDSVSFEVTVTVDGSAPDNTLVNSFGITTPTGFGPTTVANPCADDPGRSCATTTLSGAPTGGGTGGGTNPPGGNPTGSNPPAGDSTGAASLAITGGATALIGFVVGLLLVLAGTVYLIVTRRRREA